MKTILLLAACLLVAPAMTVHGSEPGVAADARAPVEETGATAGTTPRASAAQPETARQPAEAAPASEGGEGGEQPSSGMRLSSMYQVDKGVARKDGCLKGTGTRVKRDTGRVGCASGVGQTFTPDRVR